MIDRTKGRACQGWVARVVGLVAALGVACADSSSPAPADGGAARAPGASSADSGAEPDRLMLPDTPVGRELAWLLDVINARGVEVSEAELRAPADG